MNLLLQRSTQDIGNSAHISSSAQNNNKYKTKLNIQEHAPSGWEIGEERVQFGVSDLFCNLFSFFVITVDFMSLLLIFCTFCWFSVILSKYCYVLGCGGLIYEDAVCQLLQWFRANEQGSTFQVGSCLYRGDLRGVPHTQGLSHRGGAIHGRAANQVGAQCPKCMFCFPFRYLN